MEVLLSLLPPTITTSALWPLLFSEERIWESDQKDQQHLQHRRDDLRHQCCKGPGLNHHLQERHRRCAGQTALPAQNGRPLHRGQEILQPHQHCGQNIAHHFPSSVLHLQPGLLGHICQQEAHHHERQQPKLSSTGCWLDPVWLEGQTCLQESISSSCECVCVQVGEWEGSCTCVSHHVFGGFLFLEVLIFARLCRGKASLNSYRHL